MTDTQRIRRLRLAVAVLAAVCGLLAVACISLPNNRAGRLAAYQAGAANGFIRGACMATGELAPDVAGEMADDCEAAEKRHAARLAR